MVLDGTGYKHVCLAVFSLVFLEHYIVCFQDNSRGLMERLCWFKGITSLLRQNQLIICFTGTTRLTAAPPTVPTNTAHAPVVISQKPQQDAYSLVKTNGMKSKRKKKTERNKIPVRQEGDERGGQ